MKKPISPSYLLLLAVLFFLIGAAAGGQIGADFILIGAAFIVVSVISAIRKKSKKDGPETSA